MEPKGEPEGGKEKDQNDQPDKSDSSGEKKERKKSTDEKKRLLELEEEERLAEDEEGEGSGSEEEEEEPPPPEPEEPPPEPAKKKKKVVVEKKISENFYYNYEELCSFPYVTPDSGIPIDMLILMHSFGYDCRRRANIQMLDSQTLLYIAGNQLVLLDLKFRYLRYLRSTSGGGIGVITAHPNKTHFAVGEKGWKPNMIIYEYPSLKPYRILRGGTEKAYAFADFNRSGTLIATVGSSPDYMLTVWDWKQEKIVLRSKAFSQDVYRVTFSPENEEQLTTSGSGHIRFWKMALTFTGLKLQGALGRFGKTAVTDIEGYAELPDGKVLSGSEWGNMLLWEGGLIKVEICRPGHRNCHNGPINQLLLDEGEIVTVGSDGYIRVWDFETMDTADVVDDTGLMEMDPMNELLVGKNVNLGYMVKVHERGEPYWYAQDFNGAIWKLDLSFSNVTHDPECLFTFHSGKIEAVCVSPVTYILATTALDRMVRVYDFLGKVQLAEMKFKQGGTAITWAPKVANPKGGIIVVGFQDGVVRIIELYNPKGLPIVASQENLADAALRLKQAFKPHTSAVTALAYERHGEILATGSRDKTVFFFNVDEMYDPIGFISVPGPVQALQWSPPSHRENKLLIFCENGIVVQVPAPQQDYDAKSTYKMKDLPTEYFRFWSIKSQILREDEIQRREKVKEEKEKERQKWIQEQLDEGKELEEIELLEEEPEEEEEEPLPEIFHPETPSPILCGFYSAPGKFWLSLGGYDTGFLFHCAFSPMQHQKQPELREDEPFDFIRVEGAEDNAITRIWFCSSGLLMFCGMQNGAVRIYPLHQKEFSIDNIAGYWLFSLHDNEYGKIQGICSSFDDRFLVTCGADGNIFTYNILSVEDIKKVLKTKVPSPRRGLDQERAAEDIEEPNAYSIENAKQKKEYDAIMKAAERKKYLKRQELLSLRLEFQELLRMNDELPKHMQLHRAQFELDRRIRAEMDRRTAQKIRLVMKELGWEQERHRIGLRKLQERFRGNLEYDTIVVCAMRSNHQISTYRLLAISEKFYKSRKQSQSWKRRLSKYDWKAKDDLRKDSQKDLFSSQTSTILEEEAEPEKVKKKPQTLQSRIVENRMERLRKIIEKAEKAKAKIEQRKREWEELYKSKPSEDYEDPQDVEDIRYAQENMGDFKLKTATNYKIPEHMRINAAKKMNQLTSLEVAIHEKKLSMNKWIVGLRDLKVAIIEEIQCVVQALKNIQASLDPSKHLPVPPVPQLLPEETPEKKFQYDNETLLKFRQELEEQGLKVKEAMPVVPSAEAGGLGGFGGGFLHTPSVKEIDTSTRGAGSQKSVKPATTPTAVLPVGSFEMELVEPTELEVEIRKREEIRNMYMQETLIKRIDELMMTFDAELCLLRHQKLKLDIQMKTADLRHITWFQELLLLKNFEKHEDTLQERVNSLISEEDQMQHKINSCLAQIEEKKAEIVKLQEREKALYVTFHASLGENNKFAGFLLKVLKKRIKRVKKKEVEGERDDDEESEEESDEESSLESDEEESGSEDEVFDDTVCPKNCDESLFENTLQLREKRLDIEEALVEEKKAIENVKKEYEALSKKVKVVAASLDSAEWELEAYQREKQQKLNELHVVVPLKTHQVEYISNGEIPSDVSQALVFTNQSLVNLQQRITILQQEKLEQRELYKKAREQHKELIRDRKEMMIKIERLEEKCNQFMMMKFGRLVNLEALQTLSVNTNLEELKMKTMEKEQAIAMDLKKWEDRILEKRQQLMEVTKENTNKLVQMNAFCTEKVRLEEKLDALHNNLGAEFQGPRKEDLMEKEKLIALVQLQDRDAEILKEEIALLSRKDGRIFAASEPLFETDEMLN